MPAPRPQWSILMFTPATRGNPVHYPEDSTVFVAAVADSGE